MEFNLLSVETTYPNINIVFDDSIYAVDDDTSFICRVGQRFNSNITFPSYATSVMIAGSPSDFNYPIEIPQNVTNMQNFLTSAGKFNQPVNIPGNVQNLYRAFYLTNNFNQPITIPNTVSNCYEMLYNSSQNSPVTIEDGITNVSALLSTCKKYDLPTNIPDSVTNTQSMFWNCTNYNQPTNIPANAEICNTMFLGCSNFNQPVVFGNRVNSLYQTFQSCLNFNSPVTIKNAYSCASMFGFCYTFNQPITIPNGTFNCDRTFTDCVSFDSSVVIPPSVRYTTAMFFNCNSRIYNVYNSAFSQNYTNNALHHPIYFYMNNIFDATNMFYQCNTMSELYITGLQNNMQPQRMLRNNGTFRLNIYTDDVSQNYLSTASLLVNSGKPTWTNDAANGCIYNTAMNIYIYNNWDGRVPDYYWLNYYSNNGSRLLNSQYLSNGLDGTFSYGTDEWSNEPDGQPVTGITNNITADMNVYYVGTYINSVRVTTKSTGGSDASINVSVNEETEITLPYTSASSYVSFGNMLNIKYPYSTMNWGAVATTNITDGVNNYNSGDVVKVWSYSQNVNFTVYERG